MCNFLRVGEVTQIPPHGEGYKLLQKRGGRYITPWREVFVTIGEKIIWERNMYHNYIGDGFTFFRTLEQVKNFFFKKTLDSSLRYWLPKLVVARIQYEDGLGERYERDPAIEEMVALCLAYTVVEIIPKEEYLPMFTR